MQCIIFNILFNVLNVCSVLVCNGESLNTEEILDKRKAINYVRLFSSPGALVRMKFTTNGFVRVMVKELFCSSKAVNFY